MQKEKSSYYQILGVHPNASTKEIEDAYRRLAFIYHPDKNHSQQANNEMANINVAYGILKDPRKRAIHDRELGIRRNNPSPHQTTNKYSAIDPGKDDTNFIKSLEDELQEYLLTRRDARIVIVLTVLLLTLSCVTLCLFSVA